MVLEIEDLVNKHMNEWKSLRGSLPESTNFFRSAGIAADTHEVRRIDFRFGEKANFHSLPRDSEHAVQAVDPMDKRLSINISVEEKHLTQL